MLEGYAFIKMSDSKGFNSKLINTLADMNPSFGYGPNIPGYNTMPIAGKDFCADT